MDTNLNKLKEQAETNALKRLQNDFSTPEQLEQIEQQLNRQEKKKNMIESQLKSALQSHFISVNTCMNQLKDIGKSMSEIGQNVKGIQDEYKSIAKLETTLAELRREATKHKQLKSAKENVKNILNVEDLAKQAHEYVEQNKLLLAHKCLLDMEKCRNDILEELGSPSQSNTNIGDIKLVEEFFKPVREIQVLIRNHIFLIIKRMLEVAKTYPEQLVNSLRIIEREEALDEFWTKKKEETGFAPSDRPKRWRNECLDTIRQLIETKIHGCRIEERETDDKWFSKHLGNICSQLVKDLEIVKKLCEPCFPPSYKIFDYYVGRVHLVTADYLKSLIDTNQLKPQEYFVLLSWQDTYKSDYLMGHPNLGLDVDQLPDLLDDSYYNRVLAVHIDTTAKKLAYWFQNALDKNYKEWWDTQIQPMTIENYYESSLPNDINTMLSQQLELINFANDDRFTKETLKLIVNTLNNFIELLKNKIIEFKINNFKNTEILKNTFIIRLITTSNDCIRLKDCFYSTRDRYDKFIDKDEIGGPNDQYEVLATRIEGVSEICCDGVIEEMMKSLDEFFKMILSAEWVQNDRIIYSITETSSDYMSDLVHLKTDAQISLLKKWHNRIKVEYMKGFLQNLSTMSRLLRKAQFPDPNERKLVTNKIDKEVQKLESWFKSMASHLGSDSLFDFSALTLMNKIIKADDVDFIGVEIGALVKKYPEINSDMLYALLSLRGDISKTDYKEKFEDYVLPKEVPQNSKSPAKGGAGMAHKPDEAMIMLKRELKIQ